MANQFYQPPQPYPQYGQYNQYPQYNQLQYPQYGQYGLNQYQPQAPAAQAPQLNSQGMTISGKIVESQDIVKSTEIPFNSYGVFPQGDMSHVYIKTWNSDGTTKITDYIPVTEDKKVDALKPEDYTNTLNDIYKSISNLEKKIEDISNSNITPTKKNPVCKEDGGEWY